MDYQCRHKRFGRLKVIGIFGWNTADKNCLGLIQGLGLLHQCDRQPYGRNAAQTRTFDEEDQFVAAENFWKMS